MEKKSGGLSPLRVVSGRDQYGFLVLGSIIEGDELRTEDLAAVWFTRHDRTRGLKDLGLLSYG